MESYLIAVTLHSAVLTLKITTHLHFLIFQVDRLLGHETGMVVRISTETEEEFLDVKSELDKAVVHDIRSSFSFSWASQSILQNNISVTFEPQLSTAEVVKITAIYGKSLILIMCIFFPRVILIKEHLLIRIYSYTCTVTFICAWTLWRVSVALLLPRPADPQHISVLHRCFVKRLEFWNVQAVELIPFQARS